MLRIRQKTSPDNGLPPPEQASARLAPPAQTAVDQKTHAMATIDPVDAKTTLIEEHRFPPMYEHCVGFARDHTLPARRMSTCNRKGEVPGDVSAVHYLEQLVSPLI